MPFITHDYQDGSQGHWHSGQVNHQKDGCKGHYCGHLVHVCLFARNEVEKSQDAAEGLVVDHEDCHEGGHCERTSDFVLHHAVKEQVRKRHRHVCHVTMIELHHRYVFEEVSPEWLILADQSVRHNLSIHQGPSLHSTSVDSCHKCACKDVQNEAFYHHYSDDTHASQILQLCHVIRVYFCGFYEQTERVPEQSCVKSSGQAQVSGETIWTDSRPVLILWFFLESALDHPPANCSLQTSKPEQANQPISQFWLKIALELENSEGNGEPIAQDHAHLSMEELNPIDGLESLKSDALVHCLILYSFPVLFKLNSPFLIIAGISLCVRTPISHAES